MRVVNDTLFMRVVQAALFYYKFSRKSNELFYEIIIDILRNHLYTICLLL